MCMSIYANIAEKNSVHAIIWYNYIRKDNLKQLVHTILLANVTVLY